MQVKPGDTVQADVLHTIKGDAVTVPDPAQLIHLQFRRMFSGSALPTMQLARRSSPAANCNASFEIFDPRLSQCSAALAQALFSAAEAGCQPGGPRWDSNPIESGEAVSTPIPRSSSSGRMRSRDVSLRQYRE